MSPQKLFFFHNAKAGGTSLIKLLSARFDPQEICPQLYNSPTEYAGTHSSLRQYSTYSFFAGHYGYDTYRQIAATALTTTNFRNPISRIVSLYNFWKNDVDPSSEALKNNPDRDVVLYAHELPFSKFIRRDEPKLHLYLHNFHFRQLLRSPWISTPIHWWHTLLVMRRVDAMPWFFVTELFEISDHLLRQWLDVKTNKSIPRENRSTVTVKNSDVSPEDVNYLRSINRQDFAIYRHAVNRTLQRYQIT